MVDEERTTIQSFSAPADMIARVDELQRKEGYSSRSQVVRKALTHYFSLLDQPEELGPSEGVVIAFHPRASGELVSDLRHRFADLIIGYTHSHSPRGQCVDVMHITGDSSAVKDFVDSMRALRGVDLVHFNRAPII